MKDKRIDAYIEKSAEFARPILEELRARMHASVPGVTETIKWSAPYFEYQGKPLAGMAAFKHHCAFGFWHPLMRETEKADEAMGQFGRIESLGKLPSKAEFERLAKKAVQLVEDGVKGPPKPRVERKPLEVPKDLAAALKSSARARATWDGFSYSHRKEYVEWIGEAKTEETRNRRLATTLEQLAEGKSLRWKYQRR